MKKYSNNYANKMLGFTVIALMAMLKPAFSQEPAIDNDLITYSMSVSPDQQVKFRLPLDIRSGDVISGTVNEVMKNNPGEVNQASSTLQGVVIEIDGKQTKLSDRLFSFLVPAGITSLPFLLKNSAGQVIEQGQIPIGVRWQEPVGGPGTRFSPEAVGQPGQALKVTGLFDGNATNTNVSLNGQACEIIAESPRMSYVQVSQNATAGVSNLTIEESNIKEEHRLNIAVLSLSANKTTLRKGEKATISVTVSGLEDLEMNNNDLKLRLENQSPQTITFLKENNNVIIREINTTSVNHGVYEFSTGISAQSAGSFKMYAIVFRPGSKNPCVDDYNDCVKMADEEYNSKSRKCAFSASGNKRTAATCQAALIKEREEKKAACLQVFINCMKEWAK